MHSCSKNQNSEDTTEDTGALKESFPVRFTGATNETINIKCVNASEAMLEQACRICQFMSQLNKNSL